MTWFIWLARVLWDNPLVRPLIWAVAGAIALGVVLMAVLRDDRRSRQWDAQRRDYEKAEDIRERADAARRRVVRTSSIQYRD